jgi:hypothetical protein
MIFPFEGAFLADNFSPFASGRDIYSYYSRT